MTYIEVLFETHFVATNSLINLKVIDIIYYVIACIDLLSCFYVTDK